jgi:sulfur-oxidizing protein SoxY
MTGDQEAMHAGAAHFGSRRNTTRRGVLAAGIGAACVLLIRPARATPDTMKAAIHDVIGEAAVKIGRVKLDVPPLVENGNTVPLVVAVESPMTEADHVKAIYIFNEKNPQPNVANFHLGPRSGVAKVSTRIRLADSQKVIAIAQMSDGAFWSAEADVIVTLAACVEGI